MNAEGLKKFYYEKLNWCGCGDPEMALEFMADVLMLLERCSYPGRCSPLVEMVGEWECWTQEINFILGGVHSPLGLSYLYTLDAAGLLEHGSSLSGSWLTDLGREVLTAIREFPEWDKEDA